MSEIKIPISVELGNSLQKLKGLSGELNKVEGDVKGISEESTSTASAISKVGDAGKKISSEGPATFKAQLRAANEELNRTISQFGAASPAAAAAAKRVAELKDNIGDAKLLTDAFNPDAKFTAFGNALKGVTGAFSALQGAQALFGAESKAVQETLLKVQGAMALSQGINSILESKDAFIALGVQLGIVKNAKLANNAADITGAATTAASAIAAEGLAVAEGQVAVSTTAAAASMSGLKMALIATGIGAAVIAVGLLVANWEKLAGTASKYAITQQALADTTKDLQKGMAGAAEQVGKVKSSFDLAKAGVISKKEALDVYNTTLGDSFGKTNDLNVAEKNLAANAENYIRITGLKAQANALFALAAEKSAQAQLEGLNKQQEVQGQVGASGLSLLFGLSSRSKIEKDITKQVDERKKKINDEANAINEAANGLLKEAGILSKQSGLKIDLFGTGDKSAASQTKQVETAADVIKNMQDEIQKLNKLEFSDGVDRSADKLKIAQDAFNNLLTEKKLNIDDSRLKEIKRLIESYNLQELSNQISSVITGVSNELSALNRLEFGDGIDRTTEKIKVTEGALNTLLKDKKLDINDSRVKELQIILQSLNVQNLSNQVADVFTGLNNAFTELNARKVKLNVDVTDDKIKAIKDALDKLASLSIKTEIDQAAINSLQTQLNDLNADKLKNELNKSLNEITAKEKVLNVTLPKEKVDAINKAIEQALLLGIPPDSPLFEQLKNLSANVTVNIDSENAKAKAQELAKQLNQTLSGGFQDAIGSFAEGLGNVITGEGNLGDAFKAGISSIASAMQQIGKLFIEQAIAVKIFKETVFKSPYVAIAAGIALIAAGAALKNATSKKFASGGFVSGPGSGTSDSIPAMLSNGEFVINAASVRRFGVGFFNNLNTGLLKFAAGGLVSNGQTQVPIIQGDFGQMVPYIASTEIKGQDLRIVLNRATSRFNNVN